MRDALGNPRKAAELWVHATYKQGPEALSRVEGLRETLGIGLSELTDVLEMWFRQEWLDYTVAILPECCSSQTEAIQQANMQDMATIGAFMLPLADFLAQGTGPLLPTWEKEQAARQAIQAPYIQGEEHPAL